MALSHLCFHKDVALSHVPMRTLALLQGCQSNGGQGGRATLMTSFRFNYLYKALIPPPREVTFQQMNLGGGVFNPQQEVPVIHPDLQKISRHGGGHFQGGKS